MSDTRRNRQRGATIVEAALVTPIVLFLIFGVVDLARLMSAQHEAASASSEGARYAIATGDNGAGTIRYVDCDGIRTAALGSVGTSGLEPVDITVVYDEGPSTAAIETCPVGGPGPNPDNIDQGDRVSVTVSRTFTFATPIIGDFFGNLTLDSTDRRTIFK